MGRQRRPFSSGGRRVDGTWFNCEGIVLRLGDGQLVPQIPVTEPYRDHLGVPCSVSCSPVFLLSKLQSKVRAYLNTLPYARKVTEREFNLMANAGVVGATSYRGGGGR